MKKITMPILVLIFMLVIALPAQAAIIIGGGYSTLDQGSVVTITPSMYQTSNVNTSTSIVSSTEESSVVSLSGLIPTESTPVSTTTINPDDLLFQAPPANEKLVMPLLVPATSLTASEQEMVNDINTERESAGLQPLKVDFRLVELARWKAEEMYENHYFDHVSPNVGYTAALLTEVGLPANTYWSENIAGNDSVSGAMSAFMFSYGHRLNILDPNINSVGVGVIEGITPYNLYVQEFAKE